MLEYQDRPSVCNGDCFHYSRFGDREGCDVVNGGWGGWLESIKPGELCIHPESRSVSNPVVYCSIMGVCAMLEGTVVKGGPGDNTSLVNLLTKD